MVVSTAKMNARQFLMLGQDPPGVKLELVNGEVAASPGRMPGHWVVVMMLGTILNAHVQLRELSKYVSTGRGQGWGR
jgi:hypothetical protein